MLGAARWKGGREETVLIGCCERKRVLIGCCGGRKEGGQGFLFAAAVEGRKWIFWRGFGGATP